MCICNYPDSHTRVYYLAGEGAGIGGGGLHVCSMHLFSWTHTERERELDAPDIQQDAEAWRNLRALLIDLKLKSHA